MDSACSMGTPRISVSNFSGTPRTILVVDRDSARGIGLAIQVISNPDTAVTPTTAVQSSTLRLPPITLISRALSLNECDPPGNPVISNLASQVQFISANSAELELEGKEPEPGAVLILDNVSSNTHEELNSFEKLFDQVILISAYPTYVANVKTIVASASKNKFLWSSLYDSFLSRDRDVSFCDRYEKTVEKLGNSRTDVLLMNLSESLDHEVTWSLQPTLASAPPRLSFPLLAQ